jgi:glutathione synthase/RimK-type ligase-like ATP-grasp enzyme
VLLCARDDADRGLVAAALAARGATVETFDPTQFPGTGMLSLALPGPPGRDAVWCRPVVGAGLPAMPPGVRETCVAAGEMLLDGWLDGIGGYQLDPPWAQRRADNKPLQLRAARAVGLDVPATIVTNDPAAVRAFAADRKPLVVKALVQPGTGDGDGVDVVFTSPLEPDADLDGLELCPMIVQERVAKAADIRATIVGGTVLAASNDTATGTDWRRDSCLRDEAPAWSPHPLPGDVAAQLVALVRRLGLGYGAADLVRRPDGTYAFLEVNAAGSFAFLGVPVADRIAAAVADLLLGLGGSR